MLIACLQFCKFCPVLDEIWYGSGKLVVTYTAIKQENNVLKMSESSAKHIVYDLSKQRSTYNSANLVSLENVLGMSPVK